MINKDLTRKWKHTSQPSARVAFLQELSSVTLDENELEKSK